MKRIPVFFALALGALVFSCKKTDGDIQKRKDVEVSESVQQKIKEADYCEVKQIIHAPCCSLKDTLVFSYNSFGDPVYIRRLPRAGTGAPHFVFKYDKKRRLTDIIGMYESGAGAEFWHKYYYENPGNSNIVKDSSFYLVRLRGDTIINYTASAVTFFTYDKWDRIIKDSTRYFPQGMEVKNYLYDANGNIAGRTYDNKTNIHRTNKIWMFYDRDYSVNNPFPAANYNSSGLPTAFSFSFPEPYYMQFLTYFRDAVITYSCGKDKVELK
jgi:hypothetical protein